MNKIFLSAALAGVFAAGIVATTAQAADTKVKCYGIAKAGKNDCKAADASHACAGKSTKDNSKEDFNVVTDQTACDAAKGTTEAPKS